MSANGSLASQVTGIYNEMGLVVVDLQGRVGAAHSSPNLTWAYMSAEQNEPVASLTAKLIK